MLICNINVFNKYGKDLLDSMLQPYAVDWRDMVILLVLDHQPGASQQLFSDFLQLDKGNVSKIIHQLEARHLLEQRRSNADKRYKQLHLTAAGEQLVPDIQRVMQTWEDTCYHDVSKADLAQYYRINEQIINNLMKGHHCECNSKE